jgi:lipid-binding SYLF domain-containing protein
MLRLSKWAAVVAVAATAASGAVGAKAQTANQSEAKAVLLKADAALKNFRTDAKYAASVREAVRLGRAVLIVPDYIRGGIGIGGAAGTGVLMQKDDAAGWSAPRFFDVRAANIGPQLGFQKGDLMIVIANTDTLRAILSGEFTLAADASVQAGSVSEGAQASTTTAFRDTGVAVFLRGEGAYAGATVGGARISVNRELDGAQLPATEADPLRSTLSLVAPQRAAAR